MEDRKAKGEKGRSQVHRPGRAHPHHFPHLPQVQVVRDSSDGLRVDFLLLPPWESRQEITLQSYSPRYPSHSTSSRSNFRDDKHRAANVGDATEDEPNGNTPAVAPRTRFRDPTEPPR